MSSKKSTQTFEPLKLDTTLLKIDISTEGDLKTKPYDLIPFHPNMSAMKDLSNNNYILFPSFVKITMTDLKNSGAAGGGQDYKKVFTDLERFIKLIKYATRPDKEEEDFTLLVDQTQFKNYAMAAVEEFTQDITSDFREVQKYEPLTADDIITNNIGIIKNLFFPIGGRFFVLGHEYVINKSQYLPKYIPSSTVNQYLSERGRTDIPLTYTIKIDLQILDATNNPNIGEFSKLTCKAKKNIIKNDFHEIFDTKLGLPEQPKSVLPSLTVPTTTSKRGFGKLQLEWEERNKYVKPAMTENERRLQEKNWTPLQRKMAKFDKIQDDYDKIPPLWIKEKDTLVNKYKTFDEEMKAYQTRYYEDFKNEFSMTELEDKIKATLNQMLTSVDPLIEEKDKNKMYNNTTNLKNIEIRKKEKEKNIKEADKIIEAAKVKPIADQEILAAITSYTALKGKIINEAKVKPNTDQEILDAIAAYYKALGDKGENLYDFAKTIVQLNKPISRVNKIQEVFDAFKKKESELSTIPLIKEINELKAVEETAINDKYVAPFLVDMENKQKDVKVLEEEVAVLKEQLKNLQAAKDIYNASSKQQELSKRMAKLLKVKTDYEMLKDRLGEDGKKLIDKWMITQTEMTTLKKTVDTEKNIGEKKILNESVDKELKDKMKEIKDTKELILKANYFEGNQEDLTKDEIKKFVKERPIVETLEELNAILKGLKKEYLEIANKTGLYYKVQGYISLLNDDVERFKKVREAKDSEKRDKDKEIQSKNKEISEIRKAYSSADESTYNEADRSRINKLNEDKIPYENDIKKLDKTILRMRAFEEEYNKVINGLRKLKANDPALKKNAEGLGINTEKIKNILNDVGNKMVENAKKKVDDLTKIINLTDTEIEEKVNKDPKYTGLDSTNTKKIEAIKKALDAHTKAKPEAEAALLEAQTKLAAAEKTETTSSKDYEKYPITELTGGKKQTLRNFNQMQKKITKKRKLKLKLNLAH